MTDPAPDEPLEALRLRLEATQRAAERLVRETAEFVGSERAGTEGAGADSPRTERVPPNGWEAPPSSGQATGELQALAGLLETLRGVLPEDIQRQVSEIVRQLLLLVRALIDWWIARMDREHRGADVSVQDIPIS
jgi:hypothetical protein